MSQFSIALDHSPNSMLGKTALVRRKYAKFSKPIFIFVHIKLMFYIIVRCKERDEEANQGLVFGCFKLHNLHHDCVNTFDYLTELIF